MQSLGNKSLPRISRIDTDSRYISVIQCYPWEIRTMPMKHFQLITAMALCIFVLAFGNFVHWPTVVVRALNASALPTRSRILWGPRGEKLSEIMKKNFQLIVAIMLCGFGCLLLLAGFCCPPLGEIHHSVLIAFGEILTFSGSLIGIDYKYRYKEWF